MGKRKILFTKITLRYWVRFTKRGLESLEFLLISRAPSSLLKHENKMAKKRKWCVRRTPENAEVLNAFVNHLLGYESFESNSELFFNYDGIGKGYAISTNPLQEEITFEQWQTIPEHAEWLNENYQMFFDLNNGTKHLKPKPTEKVEEREIIGYEAPFDLYCENEIAIIKKGTLYIKDGIIYRPEYDLNQCNAFNWLPAELVETWKPVYRENPVFKVGEYATFKGKDTFKISRITGHYLHAEGELGYLKECCTVATPEEIEAARPKRKYMKQVWYVLVMEGKNLNCIAVSEVFHSEQEANEWVLRVSEEGRVYSVKPFEVVAYE